MSKLFQFIFIFTLGVIAFMPDLAKAGGAVICVYQAGKTTFYPRCYQDPTLDYCIQYWDTATCPSSPRVGSPSACFASTINSNCGTAAPVSGCTSPTGAEGATRPGTCPLGFTGTKTMECKAGSWKTLVDNCVAPAPVVYDCKSPNGMEGATRSSGSSCPIGQSGTTNFKCSNSNWVIESSTCATIVTASFCSAPTMANGATRTGTCPVGETGAISYRCDAPIWRILSSTCAAPAVVYDCTSPNGKNGDEVPGPSCPVGQVGAIVDRCEGSVWKTINSCVLSSASIADAELIAAQAQMGDLQTKFVDLSVQHKDVAAKNANTASGISDYSGLFVGLNSGNELSQTTNLTKRARLESDISGMGSSGSLAEGAVEDKKIMEKNKKGSNLFDKLMSSHEGKLGSKSGEKNSESNAANNAAVAAANGKNKNGDSKAYNDPWVAFMAGPSSDYLVQQLKKDPELREKVKKALKEKKKRNIASPGASESIALLENALEEAESDEPSLEALEPMSQMEAFAMDNEETSKSVKRMLAELEEKEDPQFLAHGTLFERVKGIHNRYRKELGRAALK